MRKVGDLVAIWLEGYPHSVGRFSLALDIDQMREVKPLSEED